MPASGVSGPDDGPAPVVTRRIAAEAATWIVRLHGPSRSPAMEQGLREWLARSAAHRAAFERCTDVWQDVAGLSPADVYAGAAARSLKAAFAGERRWLRVRWPLAGLLAVVLAGAAFATYRWLSQDVYVTRIGEQQVVMLEDGTRMSLNTDTHVRVKLDAKLRSVQVDDGEALFEVAKEPSRPFVVRVAGSEVTAIGTVFAVRLQGHRSEGGEQPLAVTLIEGKISVRPAAEAGQRVAAVEEVTLQAGERMLVSKGRGTSDGAAVQRLDQPQLDQVIAWKRGEAWFERAPLPDAVNEMNRYTRTPIVLVGDMSKLNVSGRFHTGDSASFAGAVATLHGLQLREHSGRLELAPPP